MAATGTIALKSNTLTVTGSGTKFTTEAQVGGALVTYIDNVPYTFVVGAINSDTSITLTANYQGSNVSGQSFSLIDRGAYTAITAELGARTAQAIRGLNYDKSNWQQILTGSGNVTVNVPDGSQYTGPSWISLSESLGKKVDSDDDRLESINGKLGGTVNGSVNLTTGDSNNSSLSLMNNPSRDTGSGATNDYGSLSVGWYQNGWLNYGVVGFKEYVGNYFYTLIANYSSGTWYNWEFRTGGNAVATGGSWISNSDQRIKKEIKKIDTPLKKLISIRGVTWIRRDTNNPGIGFIAQDVQSVFPDAVFDGGSIKVDSGEVIEKVLSVDTSGVAAALHQEAILHLMSIQRKALLALSDPSLSDEDKQSALKELATLIPDESEYADQ